jgi:hypothetical protein
MQRQLRDHLGRLLDLSLTAVGVMDPPDLLGVSLVTKPYKVWHGPMRPRM